LISGYIWVGFGIVWMIWAIRTKPTERRESASSRLLYVVFLMAGSYLLVFHHFFSHRPLLAWLDNRILRQGLGAKATGIALTTIGVLFAIWARLYLGRNWSGTVTVKVGHELVRSGPYRWVRHPIYSGLLIALTGTAIELGQTRGMFSIVLVYIGFRLKVRIEEQFMTEVFGAEYDEYRRATGALIPRAKRERHD
jgi:protein-S-isoprenylcysteine O-methyltransferase Ste14